MEILIDTNILFGNWTLRSEDAEAFLDYVERSGSIIYIPRIVWEETGKNYKDDIIKKHKNYTSASKLFGSSLVIQPEMKRVELDYDTETENYLEWLRNKFKFNGLDNILPYGDWTERTANRIMAKRKPFNLENNHEYKDSLVWETVLDVASGLLGRGDEEIVLISNDSNAFGANAVHPGKQQPPRNQKAEKQAGVLHPQLQEDIDAAISTGKAKYFYYYESFGEFLAAHYTPIKGINEQAVREYLQQDASGFKDLLLQAVRTRSAGLAIATKSINSLFYIDLLQETFEIDKVSEIQDFYVYSFRKGERVTASGRIFAYLKINIKYRYANSAPNLEDIIRPIAEVKFTLNYLDNKPENIQFESLDIPSHTGLRLSLRAPTLSKTAQLLSDIEMYSSEYTIPPDFLTLNEKLISGLNQGIANSMTQKILDSWYFTDAGTSSILVQHKWGEVSEIERKLNEPSSKFLPKKEPSKPIPPGTKSKRKKKGAKKR